MEEVKNEENKDEKEEQEIEVVTGDGSNLNISPVYEHIPNTQPKNKKPTNIIMPKEIKKEKDENNKN